MSSSELTVRVQAGRRTVRLTPRASEALRALADRLQRDPGQCIELAVLGLLAALQPRTREPFVTSDKKSAGAAVRLLRAAEQPRVCYATLARVPCAGEYLEVEGLYRVGVVVHTPAAATVADVHVERVEPLPGLPDLTHEANLSKK